MLGLNTTATIRRKTFSTGKWSAVYTNLKGRVEDVRESDKSDPEFRGFTDYTHIFFTPYKHSGSTVVIQIKDIWYDNKFPTVTYRVMAVVDAAGAQHHFELQLKRIDKT